MDDRSLVARLIQIGVEANREAAGSYARPSEDPEIGTIGTARLANWLEELGRRNLVGDVQPCFTSSGAGFLFQVTDEAVRLWSDKQRFELWMSESFPSTIQYDIFISYAASDSHIAQELQADLEKSGLTCFMAEKHIEVSADWQDSIRQALNGSKRVLVLLTPRSVGRPWVLMETGAAWVLAKPLVPAISQVDPKDLPDPIRRHQARIVETTAGRQRLVAELAAQLRGSGSSPPDPLKEPEMEPEPVPDPKTDLTILTESTTEFFLGRTRSAFGGKRGLVYFRDAEVAVGRLAILLADPLVFRRPDRGRVEPVWWWRGMSNSAITKFCIVSPTRFLMNIDEIEVDFIAAFRSQSYYQDFVYVQAKPDAPVGLYNYTLGEIESAAKNLEVFSEEYGLFKGRPILRTEYDDGAAEIDGRMVETVGAAELRCRYLTPYNFVIAPHYGPINNKSFDPILRTMLRRLIAGNTDLEGLVEEVDRLPREPED